MARYLARFLAVIPQVMNGLTRNAFGTEFSGIVWLYALFPTMVAYGLSQVITRVFAFLGMYLLLRDHLLEGEEWGMIRVGSSTNLCINSFLAFRNVKYTWYAPCLMGVFAYSKREKILERICCFHPPSILLKPGSWFFLFLILVWGFFG